MTFRRDVGTIAALHFLGVLFVCACVGALCGVAGTLLLLWGWP